MRSLASRPALWCDRARLHSRCFVHRWFRPAFIGLSSFPSPSANDISTELCLFCSMFVANAVIWCREDGGHLCRVWPEPPSVRQLWNSVLLQWVACLIVSRVFLQPDSAHPCGVSANMIVSRFVCHRVGRGRPVSALSVRRACALSWRPVSPFRDHSVDSQDDRLYPLESADCRRTP